MDEYVIAVDLGTGSVRALLFDEQGRQVAAASREWVHHPEPGVEGSQVFETEGNWSHLVACIREVLGSPGVDPQRVKAISASSMREGFVLLDASGREIWACPNVDARASDQALALVEAGLASRIFEVAGDWVSITAPSRLMWIKEKEPSIWGQIAGLAMLSDWALYRLSGQLITDPSAGSSSGMFNLENRTWSEDIVEWLGLDHGILPEVVESGTVIGNITERAAAETGLAPNTRVVAGGADTQLALVGLGESNQTTATVIGGSFWQATSLEAQAVIDPEARLRTLCHSQPGSWMIEGIGFWTGMALRWFRDAFCGAEVSQARLEGASSYHVLDRLADSAPVGAGGLVAINSNVMNAKRWVHAAPAFLQLSIAGSEPTGKAHFIRAIQESAAYVTRSHLEIIEDVVGRTFDKLRFTGGASNGSVWPQMLADVCGRPVEVASITESTSLGAAKYAAVGAGWFDNPSVAFAGFRPAERVFEPSGESQAQYEHHFQKWRHLYPRMLDLVEDGHLDPMWWPAGSEKPAPMKFAE